MAKRTPKTCSAPLRNGDSAALKFTRCDKPATHAVRSYFNFPTNLKDRNLYHCTECAATYNRLHLMAPQSTPLGDPEPANLPELSAMLPGGRRRR